MLNVYKNQQNRQTGSRNLMGDYLVFVGEFKKNVTRQTWRALFHLGE
jgi:hypothetical protein